MLKRRHPSAKLERLAINQLKQGKLPYALASYMELAKKFPKVLAYHIQYSAILYYLGKREAARKAIDKGVAIRPYLFKPTTPDPEGKILRLRGVQKAFFTLDHIGPAYEVKVTGGGFSTAHLMDLGRFWSIDYLVSHGNLPADRRLPSFDIIVNSIADADVEDDSLKTISDFAKMNPDRPLINAPDRVMQTTRDSNYRRLKDIEGIIFPKTYRHACGNFSLDELDRFVQAGDLSFPFLVRESGTQSGKSFDLVASLEALQGRLEKPIQGDYYLIEFIEEKFREKYFRKIRFFCIDGKLYPVVCHVDQIWNVHGFNRLQFMAANEWMVDEEKRFLSDPKGYLGKDIYDRIRSLYEIVGLDFYGLDFTVTGQGDVLIYELNPAMRHSFDHAKNFPYMGRHMQNISDAFNDMIVSRLGRLKLPAT